MARRHKDKTKRHRHQCERQSWRKYSINEFIILIILLSLWVLQLVRRQQQYIIRLMCHLCIYICIETKCNHKQIESKESLLCNQIHILTFHDFLQSFDDNIQIDISWTTKSRIAITAHFTSFFFTLSTLFTRDMMKFFDALFLSCFIFFFVFVLLCTIHWSCTLYAQ